MKLGDHTYLSKNKVDPEELNPNTKYIGLEHIGEGTLSLNGFGYSSDVNSSKAVFKKGDILFGKLRPYFRKIIIAPFDGICSTDIWVIKPKNGIDRNFLFYWMASQHFVDEVTRSSEGTRMPRAKWEVASKIEIPDVEVVDQKEIGEILYTLDQKIHLNQQTNETLEAMAEAIFKSWFVDFDPVRAKIAAKKAGRDPEKAAMAAIAGVSLPSFAEASEGRGWDDIEAALQQKLNRMTPEQATQLRHTASLFPDELVDSELGEVPKGWGVKTFKEICEDIQSGGTPKRSEPEYWGEGYPWLSSGEIRNRYILKSEEQITEKGLAESNAKLWPSGSTVVAMYGATAGVTAYLANEMCANQACCCLIPDGNSVYVFISALRASKELSGKSTGSAQQNLNKGIIERHQIIAPDDYIIKAFERVALPMIEKIISNENQNSLLSELRDTLLPKLISGEIGVNLKQFT